MKSLFFAVRDKNIKVCTICPGFVNTDMAALLFNKSLDTMIQSEDIADTVAFVTKVSSKDQPSDLLPSLTPKSSLATLVQQRSRSCLNAATTKRHLATCKMLRKVAEQRRSPCKVILCWPRDEFVALPRFSCVSGIREGKRRLKGDGAMSRANQVAVPWRWVPSRFFAESVAQSKAS